jgi:adenylate cyclase
VSFFSELNRRNVVRVGLAYLFGAWLALQVVDVVLPMLAAPAWAGKTVLILLLIGLPVTLVLAWVYEITPEGVKLESEIDRSDSVSRVTGRKLDFVIIGVLSVAVIFFALDRFLWRSEAVAVATDTRAIAVLPFANLSADPEQEYLSDGLAEEMLNLLASIPELRVTSRSTAFTYKGKDYRVPDVGRELGVSHILEGSVRRSGDEVRITARLLDAAADAQIWSETWERQLVDVFAIQDEIANAVVDGLKISLLGEVPHVERTSPEAYSLYLQAGQLLNRRNADSALQAESALIRALEIDPGYVAAWLRLARTYGQGGAVGAWHPGQSYPLVRNAATEAQRLDTDNVTALAELANVSIFYDYDLDTARAYLKEARMLDPDNKSVQFSELTIVMMLGNYDIAILALEALAAADPANTNLRYVLGQMYMTARRFEEAKSSFAQAIELSPTSAGSHLYLAAVLILEGDYDTPRDLIDEETRDGYRAMGYALLSYAAGRRSEADARLQDLIDLGYRWTYQIAAVHAFRNEADDAFIWLDRAIGRRDTSLSLIVGDPFMDNIRDDPRFDVILERIGRAPR